MKDKMKLSVNNREGTLIITIAVIFVAMCILKGELFYARSNIEAIFSNLAYDLLLACGMTFVILTGGIDLSVGSILGLAGVLASGILESTGNAGAAILVALAVGIGCGAVNGFFVAVCEIPPFISTLGMMTLLRGCILVYTKGSPIPIKVDAYKFFGKGTVAGVPVPVIILIILFLIAHYVLTQTSYGRSIYAFGGNREAARLSGISVRFTEWMAYTLNGTSLSGGVGFVLPTVVGAMIMGIIDNILTLMNVNPHATNIVKGAVILIAVLVDKKVKDLSAKAE